MFYVGQIKRKLEAKRYGSAKDAKNTMSTRTENVNKKDSCS